MGDESNNSTELSEISPLPNVDRLGHANCGAKHDRHRRVSQWGITPIEGAQWQQHSANDWHNDSSPLFIEMLELVEDVRGKFEWRESARWIKYEESVERASERWSKPFVPSLNYPSVQTLRNLLLQGTVELDMCAEDLKSIFISITNAWGHPELVQVLTRRHVHLYERGHSMLEDVIPNYGKNKQVERSRKISEAVSIAGSGGDEGKKKGNTSFMKKIPTGAEACNVMVGEVEYLDEPLSAFVRLRKPVMLGNIVEVAVPTRFMLVILVPKDRLQEYVQVGRAMGALMSDPNYKTTAHNAKSNLDLVSGIDSFLKAVTLLPPAGWDPSIRIEPVGKEQHGAVAVGEEGQVQVHEGLARTGRLFGGLIQDIKRKLPWYRSDFTDALSLQCLATWLFLYFACLTPMITFGGILGEATENQMGTMEVMVSGCICGIVFALFGGQPLLILGSTGPMLVFEKIIIQLTESFEFEYMEFRVWIGIWIGVILLILVATDASAFVTYITRFTEENFATLVACIFIYEAVKNLIHIKDPEEEDHEDVYNHTDQDHHIPRVVHPPPHSAATESPLFMKEDRGTVFLTSILLFVATFAISFTLKEFRSTRFFPTRVRYIVSDFAVIIAIVVMAGVDYALDIDTPKLKVPEKFAPTIPDRGWLINPVKHNEVWTIAAALVPALLATILIFMDQQITAVILNRKDHKLKKGAGYHLDLLVLSVLIITCSLLGLPWFIAATVESLTNLNSLKTESESSAPGEKPQFLGVREQRVTNILIFTTVGLSVLFTSLLKVVPMPVLYGVFLYMGISALRRMELFERVLLVFMPSKYQPDSMYLRTVKIVKVHLYTGIQVLCLVVLWVIKSVQVTSIGFPLMLLVMMLVRKLLEYIFTLDELSSLDDLLPGTRLEKGKRDSKSSAVEVHTTAIGNGNALGHAEEKVDPSAMV